MTGISANAALLVIDIEKGFDDTHLPPRNNPRCEDNVTALVRAWRAAGRPLVLVRHESKEPDSPLVPGPGTEFKQVLVDAMDGAEPDILVTKSVHSSFYGSPNLDVWLRARGVSQLVICGIQTNYCCETTARMAGNLGYDVLFALDATHTFDEAGPDGTVITAEEFGRVTAAVIDGSFGRVARTADVLQMSGNV